MTEPAKIGGVNVTAPLWNKAPEADIRAIVRMMSDASHHFADDSGKEWSLGYSLRDNAAAEINRLRLGAYAIRCLVREQPQLVTEGDLIDAVLKDARK